MADRQDGRPDTARQSPYSSRLAEERHRLGLTQKQFAQLIGVSSPKQSLYESGGRELRGDYLEKIAAVGVDLLYVLTGRRSEGVMRAHAASLLSSFCALPPTTQEAVLAFARSLVAEQRQGRGLRDRNHLR